MSPKARRRLIAATAIVVSVGLLAIMFWRAFVTRPGGRFPILDDIPVVRADVPSAKEKVRPKLAKLVLEAKKRGDDSVAFLVDLADQVDMTEFASLLNSRGDIGKRSKRRDAFLDAFRILAEDRQRELLATLERMREAGRVERMDAFKIVNRVHVVARDPGVVEELAARKDVAMLVEPDEGPTPSRIERKNSGVPTDTDSPLELRCWAIANMRAPEAWKRGLDGKGVVVGLLGTGARGDHEQLRGNWRGAVDPSRAAESWYHPEQPGSTRPTDTQQHGTGVLAAAVAQNKPRAEGQPVEIGIAPGATWVAAAAYVSGYINFVYVTAAVEWLAYAAKPDVVVNSYTFPKDATDPMLERMLSALKVTETVVVLAAGNNGPTRGHNFAPQNFPHLEPFRVPAFSVGSIDRHGQLSRFSARGPSSQDNTGPFPQVVAPGEDLTIAFPLSHDGLMRNLGTSYSAGYVAGAAAILLQAGPGTPPNQIEHVLKVSARQLGEGKPNNDAGWGAVDIVAALEELERRRKDPKSLQESGW